MRWETRGWDCQQLAHDWQVYEDSPPLQRPVIRVESAIGTKRKIIASIKIVQMLSIFCRSVFAQPERHSLACRQPFPPSS